MENYSINRINKLKNKIANCLLKIEHLKLEINICNKMDADINDELPPPPILYRSTSTYNEDNETFIERLRTTIDEQNNNITRLKNKIINVYIPKDSILCSKKRKM
jgi:hypothetical protein